MPSHTISSGMRPRNGSDRIICIGPSTISSPKRERPATSPRTVPIETPMASPITTRRSDVRIDGPSWPDVHESTNACQTSTGEASVPLSIQPAHDAICQSDDEQERDERAAADGGGALQPAARAPGRAGEGPRLGRGEGGGIDRRMGHAFPRWHGIRLLSTKTIK